MISHLNRQIFILISSIAYFSPGEKIEYMIAYVTDDCMKFSRKKKEKVICWISRRWFYYFLYFSSILFQFNQVRQFVLYFNISFYSLIESYEIPSIHSNEFLKSSIFGRRKYEESRETVEAKREVSDWRRHGYVIVIFFRHVLMNIEKRTNRTIDEIPYHPSVFNTVTKRRIAEKMRVEFECNDHWFIFMRHLF